MPASSLDDFKDVLAEVGTLSKASFAGITALPLVALAVDLSPPWPKGAAVATCLIELVVLMLAFHFARRASTKLVGRLLILSSICLMAACILYFALVSLFVYEAPNGDRFVKGYQCTSVAMKVYGDDCPLLAKRTIAEANYDADRIWTQVSLLAVRLSLLLSWSLAFVFLSCLTGCFVVYHIRRPSR